MKLTREINLTNRTSLKGIRKTSRNISTGYRSGPLAHFFCKFSSYCNYTNYSFGKPLNKQ